MYVVNNGTFMYAKHGKLVESDASAPKPVQNTFNHVYRSFKVTHFGITEKPTRDCVLLHTDRQTDRRTTCNLITALCGKKEQTERTHSDTVGPDSKATLELF